MNRDRPSKHHGELTDEELREILADHQLWIDTDGTEGARADLSDIVDIMGGRLAGANLAGAIMPSHLQRFREILHIDKTVAIARPIYLVLLLLCGYTIVVVLSTNDLSIITNKPVQLLPESGLGVPTSGFLESVSILIMGMYMYLHIYLYRLWQNLGQLPSVFHDGTPLDQAVSPWIVTGYVRFHQRHGVQKPSVLGVAQKWLTALLVWWLAPITLVLIWARYLVRHDWGGTLLHVVLVAIAVFGAVLLHRFAKAGLCRRERPMESRAGKALGIIGLVAVGAMTFVLSKSAIDLSKGSVGGQGPPFAWTRPTTWVEAALNVIDMAPCADLQRADLSGADLSGADLRCADLREAKLGQSGSDRRDGSTRLVGTDLRGADLTGAVLVGANLKGVRLDRARLGNANLQQAQLPEASLSQANLKDAVLCYADLGFADLADARLSGANLYGADLVNVDLRGAGLSHADLRDTNLSNAKLQDAELPDASLDQAILHRANFEGADLGHARLDFADLKFAKGLTQEQLDQACGKNVYNMPNGLTIGPCTEAAETRELACGAP